LYDSNKSNETQEFYFVMTKCLILEAHQHSPKLFEEDSVSLSSDLIHQLSAKPAAAAGQDDMQQLKCAQRFKSPQAKQEQLKSPPIKVESTVRREPINSEPVVRREPIRLKPDSTDDQSKVLSQTTEVADGKGGKRTIFEGIGPTDEVSGVLMATGNVSISLSVQCSHGYRQCKYLSKCPVFSWLLAM